MADQYLDTETRHRIPSLAGRCVRAGLTPEEARDVWRYQVSPAVWTNAFDVAGEWALWDSEWLVRTIERLHSRAMWMPLPLANAFYFVTAGIADGRCRAMEECMRYFRGLGADEDVARVEGDLEWLAEVFFDMHTSMGGLGSSSRRELERLYEDAFVGIFVPLLVDNPDGPTPESEGICRARVSQRLEKLVEDSSDAGSLQLAA